MRPASLKRLMYSPGLRPAVSTIFTPSSITTSQYAP